MARKIEGFYAYFGLTARYGQEAQGLAAYFRETVGFHGEIQKLKAEIGNARRLGKDKGIAGRPMHLDRMGVNISNEGRVIGATPIEDWIGSESLLAELHGEIARGISTERLWEIADKLNNLPRIRVGDMERAYLFKASKIILVTQGDIFQKIKNSFHP